MTATPSASTPATLDQFALIPRDHLFGNPTKAQGKLSPDGKWLSWLAPVDGVLNIWVSPRHDQSAAKPITKATERPIRSSMWSPDSTAVLYIQDKGGDENFLLYSVNVESGVETTLTPFENTRVDIVGGSESIRDAILVGLNNRDPQFHDVHRLNLTTGELELVYENNLYAGFVADDTLTLRMAMAQN